MANTLNGNTFYIDTQHSQDSDALDRKQTLVTYITVTATGANGRIVLGDRTAAASAKIDLRILASGESENFFYDMNPILFPNGIQAILVSNAVATVVIKSPGG